MYKLPLSCWWFYVGQAGRCIIVRLRQYRSFLSASPSAHLVAHYDRCSCQAVFETTTDLRKHKNISRKQLHESFCIQRLGASSISKPSLSLKKKIICKIERLHGKVIGLGSDVICCRMYQVNVWINRTVVVAKCGFHLDVSYEETRVQSALVFSNAGSQRSTRVAQV